MARKGSGRRSGTSGRSGLGRWLLWGGVLVVVLGVSVLLAVELAQPEAPPPPELEAVETFPDQGVQHIGTDEPTPEYNSNPPTSGPHSPVPAACGIYRQPVPDVNQVHTLEHGAVIVQYHPDLPTEQVETLEGINWSPAAKVIVAPRPDNPAPIALTAWTKRLLLDEADTDVIVGFQREFGNQSPEPGAPCPMEVDQTR